MKVDELHKGLTDSGYLCTRQFAAQVSASMHNKPVAGAFLYGSAGTGKSYLPIIISKITGHKMFFFQCAPGTKEDDLLMKMWPDEKTPSGVKISPGALYKAAEASLTQKVILVLDEWDKTRPTADAFFLDFFQYGRISLPGKEATANFDNLTIFFTANDERDFGEAFQRRFPKIDMAPLSPKLIKQALELTHLDNPHLMTMVMLYKRTLAAKLPKAATIQELRQLLDAIDHLGEDADWNTLVYQFVTKTEENHLLLAKAEDLPEATIDRVVTELDSSMYGGNVTEEQEETALTSMPDPAILLIGDIEPEDTGETVRAEDSTLILDKNKSGYTFAYHLNDCELPVESSGRLQWVKVCGSRLIGERPMYITDAERASRLYNSTHNRDRVKGEILLTEPLATYDDITWIVNCAPNLHVLKGDDNEVVCRAYFGREDFEGDDKVDIRWTKQGGLDMICSLRWLAKALEQVFGLYDTGNHPSNNLLSYKTTSGFNEYTNATSQEGLVGSMFLKALTRRSNTYMDCMFDYGWGIDRYTEPMNDKDIPHHRDFVNLDNMVIKPTKMHKTYTYGNVEWKFYHWRHKRNTKLRIRIKGKVEEAVSPFLNAYSFSGIVPLTKACIHGQAYMDIKDSMMADGWKIRPDSTTFMKSSFKARVLDNVIVFSTCLIPESWPENFEHHTNTCMKVLDAFCDEYGN